MRRSLIPIPTFQKTIWDYYHRHKRSMPWRETDDPYKIFVSEVMLQQTQVSRVLEKYPVFIKRFPSFSALAKAPTSSVIASWQGLGYNRRALFLKKSAEIIVRDYDGKLPDSRDILLLLPGIGSGTAGSIGAFAFNKPSVFIETNIRRVFIHFFFPKKISVDDRVLEPYIAHSLDTYRAREWYWALMDYGAMLGRTTENSNRQSKHYTKQKKFVGSVRQVRGAIVRALLQKRSATNKQLVHITGYEEVRISEALEALCKDKLVERKRGAYTLP